MTFIPVLTHATERDIDLLLVEELFCSPNFVAWLLNRALGGKITVEKSEVLHSARRMHNRREIDITLGASTPSGRYILLIENKLDAAEQPDQSQSYRDEAEALAEPGLKVLTCLVSPKSYAAKNPVFASGFDFVLSYETIENYFAQAALRETQAVASRLKYRAELMRQAINKGRRGYTQVIHPSKREFTKRYIPLARDLAPGLIPGPSMLRESAAESVTMIFAPETLPNWSFLPKMRIVHQLREGNANLNFYTWGEQFDAIADQLGRAVQGLGFRAEPTKNRRKGGKASLKVIVDTPRVDHLADFDAQLPAIRTGILKTNELLEWFLSRKTEVSRWAKVVSS